MPSSGPPSHPLQEQLAARRQGQGATQQLKTATVLFMDVVGSTRLSERLDAEDVHAVMDSALERLTGIVQAHQRSRPAIRRRQPARRVRCRPGARGRRRARGPRRPGDRRRGARRSPTDFARASASTASTCASASTPARCCSAAASTPKEASAASPSTSPPAWSRRRPPARSGSATRPTGTCAASSTSSRRRRSRSRASPRRRAATSSCAPSPARFAWPTAAWRESRRRWSAATPSWRGSAKRSRAACEDKRLKQVTIVGEPGIGKSRLGLEFTHWLELLREPVRFFQGRPQPYGNNVPYGLLRDLLAWRFEILESDSQSTAQGKLAAGLAPVLGDRAAEYTALIGELIGFDYHDDPHIAAIAGEAKQIRNRAFHALASYFRALHSHERHADRAAARRPALGRRRLARLRRPPGPGLRRRADLRPLPDAIDAVRAPAALGQQRPERSSAHRSRAALQTRHARADRSAAPPPRSGSDRAARPAGEQRRRQSLFRRRAHRHAHRRRRHRHRPRAVARLGRQAARRARAVDARRRPAGAHRQPAARGEVGAAAGQRDRPRVLGRGAAAHRARRPAPRSTA